MKAMIFAAGLGTRLRPLTDTRPKALVEVAGRPLLDIVAGTLVAQGCDSLVVNAHHFADQIIEHVHSGGAALQDCPCFPQDAEAHMFHGVPTAVSDESGHLLDTGGGILKARPLLQGGGRFLVHNVDILSNLKLGELLAAARPDAMATLVVSRRKTSRYLLLDQDMRLVGWTDIRTGEVRSPYPELACAPKTSTKSPETRKDGASVAPDGLRALAFSGIHMLSDGIFDEMSRLHASGDAFPIIDFYLSVADRCPIYGYEPANLELIDVGKPDTLALAEAFLRG